MVSCKVFIQYERERQRQRQRRAENSPNLIWNSFSFCLSLLPERHQVIIWGTKERTDIMITANTSWLLWEKNNIHFVGQVTCYWYIVHKLTLWYTNSIGRASTHLCYYHAWTSGHNGHCSHSYEKNWNLEWELRQYTGWTQEIELESYEHHCYLAGTCTHRPFHWFQCCESVHAFHESTTEKEIIM